MKHKTSVKHENVNETKKDLLKNSFISIVYFMGVILRILFVFIANYLCSWIIYGVIYLCYSLDTGVSSIPKDSQFHTFSHFCFSLFSNLCCAFGVREWYWTRSHLGEFAIDAGCVRDLKIFSAFLLLLSQPPFWICRKKDFNKKWLADVEKIRTIINTAINSISDLTTSNESQSIRDKLKAIQITAIEREIHKSLGKLNDFNIYFVSPFRFIPFSI